MMPDVMDRPLRHRSPRHPVTGWLAVLALVAVLAPSFVRYAGPEAAGWFAGHGHVYRDAHAATQPHAHPWDVSRGPGSAGPHADAPPTVVATPGELGTPGGFPAILVPAATAAVIAWLTGRVEAPVRRLTGLRPAPLLPPPLG